MLPFISTRKGLEGGKADEAQIQIILTLLALAALIVFFLIVPLMVLRNRRS